ncbi:hypothetical protein SUGI_0100790 [Cryptomeria japonica]|uniref:uncharacterized protein LOC131042102 n=1 Tax=Cryptomeria japonica TaxID=3369 RepID=UPI002408A289|nr:uncharacterized protein LOC131042102 [Cryptomeria japonica]XP_057831396.1 uncharacterized protein LOC131042102 [Cryptomeria japonica]XP_057831397.1 uncharacterized protein LOC131042102 [Cryptomeria japonica]GLJ09051.1 hypothetical protein SUGI_0100790 [Cryptomeria japonica]
MDRYQRVEKPKPETAINQNEIRVTTQGLIRNYISYASSLLQDKTTPEIVLKAMGQAISKVVAIAEIIKRRVPGLHQITSISSTSITDVWEPIEEGLLPLETTRHVSMITITLSTKELDATATGYQAPLPSDQTKLNSSVNIGGNRGRGRGQGRGRGRGRGRSENSGYYDNERNYGGYYNGGGWYVGWGRGRGRGVFRGRGRGRGRGRRGRGRGAAAVEVEA